MTADREQTRRECWRPEDWAAALEQAERERDEAKDALEVTRGAVTDGMNRLAKVPALVEALREVVAHGDDDHEPRICYLPMISAAQDALAVWEQE